MDIVEGKLYAGKHGGLFECVKVREGGSLFRSALYPGSGEFVLYKDQIYREATLDDLLAVMKSEGEQINDLYDRIKKHDERIQILLGWWNKVD